MPNDVNRLNRKKSLYARYQKFKPFSDDEAWMLFKLAAFSEAVGWTLLIIGIICRDYLMHGNDYVLQLSGRIHGMLFLLYVVAVIVLAPSLGWSWFKTLIAGFFSVPPYGSILLEILVSSRRKRTALKQLYAISISRPDYT